MKLCIDPGHGGSSTGAVGKYSYEKNLNLDISLKLQTILTKFGINVVVTRKDDSYVSLEERCNIANQNKCDYFLSIHCNSFSDSIVSGTETYYYDGSEESKAFATKIQYAAVGYNNNKNRGIKTADFYVLVYTSMPAVLLECAFISNSTEEDMLNNKDWQDGFVQSIGTVIAQYFGIDTGTGNPQQDIIYYVFLNDIQKDSFKEKESAIKMASDLLLSIGSGHVKVTSSNGEIIMDEVKTGGGGTTTPPATSKVAIMQLERAMVSQMEKFVHDVNPSAPYLAEKYLKYGDMEGVKGDMAFAQAIQETNYFRFTGIVKAGQNNFCGLGAVGVRNTGASFATVDDGIKAHIQHLKAYASTQSLNTSLVDPRFGLIARGSAPNWQDLNGKWAVPGIGYGESIIDIWKRILQVKID